MMFKTHIALGVFFGLIFLNFVESKIIFLVMVLVFSILPDIDMSKSYIGKFKVLRPLQWIVKHRGFFHSFTLALAISIFFAFYIPLLSFSIFLGYSTHLIGDSLTSEGIRPFWPSKKEIKWKIKTGGKAEKMVLYLLVILNTILLIRILI